MILFCLPYAGGSEAIFSSWKKHLSPEIEVIPLSLKGRGKRFRESLYINIDDAIHDIYESMHEYIDNRDYAIYGHSMGGLLTYEMYYKICNEGIKKPVHLFLSGCVAPHYVSKREKIHQLDDSEFINKVVTFGGTPNELIENKRLLNIFLPILRSDFSLVDNYKFEFKAEKVTCDISVLNGADDEYANNEIAAWSEYTDNSFNNYVFDGGHFFINENVKSITEIIYGTLQNFI